MEMPVPCCRCGEIVELNSTKESPLNSQLLCEDCFRSDDDVNDFVEEAKDIHYDLQNNAGYMKGDRRGWKKNLKELKDKIARAGYSFDDYV